jgi:2-polyprenyl-3-methyl-5-hydroxy-6-metoxy-1,4-benzoquinol methylase
MIKELFSITTTILLACTCLQAQSAEAAQERAANQYMHHANFDELVARFEDPSRAEWQKPENIIASLGPLAAKTVADIGAGTGYFAFPIAKKAAKVIAIDKRFLDYIEHKKQTQQIGANIDTRFTTPDSSGLKPHEADIVLIVDTYHHIEVRVEYLKRLKKCFGEGGVIVIVEFKKEKTPQGPPVELRLAEEQVESELKSAGFTIVSVDRNILPYTSSRPTNRASSDLVRVTCRESATVAARLRHVVLEMFGLAVPARTQQQQAV